MKLLARNDHGFSLVEVMIVCVVFAILAILASRAGLDGVRNADSLLRHAETERRAIVALHRMVKDIVSLAPLAGEKTNADNFLLDGRPAARMTFHSRGRMVSAAHNETEIFLLSYETRVSPQGLALYRRESQAGKRPRLEAPWHLLADGLDAVRFEFMDARGVWHQSWPPFLGGPAARPAVVRVGLSFSQGRQRPSWPLATSVAVLTETAETGP